MKSWYYSANGRSWFDELTGDSADLDARKMAAFLMKSYEANNGTRALGIDFTIISDDEFTMTDDNDTVVPVWRFRKLEGVGQ